MTALLRWIAVGLLVSLVVLAGVAAEHSTPTKAPATAERLQTALERAEANDAAAIPQLIDLLGELPADECRTVEEYLTQLAGPWMPTLPASDHSADARKSRRDAWMKWWRAGDGQAQLAAIHKHVPTPELRRKMTKLIDQLGNDEFAVREAAQKELLRLGRITLPQLRQAKASGDPETARRARHLVERLENDPRTQLSRAAVRLLALYKPRGATAALVSYFPFAEEDGLAEDTQAALRVLALREGKPDAALLRALDDESPLVRAAAGEALASGGGREGRKAVRKLLADKMPSVRLSIARALVRMGEKDGVPVLIELLSVLPEGQVGEAEEALYQLAGDTPPKLPDDKTKRRDAWADWWKSNNHRVALRPAAMHPMLGYTLICDPLRQRVYEIDRSGKERWAIAGLEAPVDAVVLPGERVLIAESVGRRVTVRDLKGRVLWEKAKLATDPYNVQRLANGHTLIALCGHAILEVDDAGKIVSRTEGANGVLGALRSRRGTLVFATSHNRCHVLDKDGKELLEFTPKYPLDERWPGCLDVLADGRILLASHERGKVVEYNGRGELLREWTAPRVATVTGLPNGHVLVSSMEAKRVVELDKAGNIVWKQTNVAAYRARRR